MRAPAVAALFLVCALALAACDGSAQAPEDPQTSAPPATPTESSTDVSGTDEEALHRVAEAAANTTEAGTARFEMTVETEGTGTGDGQQPVEVQGEEDFTVSQRSLRFVGPGGELQVVIDDTEVYVQIPATEDDNWARVELEEMMSDGVGFGGPAGLPFQSAADNLAVLGDAVTAVAEAGEEDVRGEPATRYDLVVDLERAAEQSADDTNETFQMLVDESGVTELDMQVWVDAEDRINRVAYSLDLSQADVEEMASEIASEDIEAEASGVVTVTVEYFDFGETLAIEIPDEDSVVDVDEDAIRESMGAGTTGPTASPTAEPSE